MKDNRQVTKHNMVRKAIKNMASVLDIVDDAIKKIKPIGDYDYYMDRKNR